MKIINPWKKLEEIKIYENPWIRVDEHKVINPSGKPGIYGKVSFKNKAISITDEEGFIFLAMNLSFGETEFDETESLTIKKITLEEAIRMVMYDEITDTISIVGIIKADRILKR